MRLPAASLPNTTKYEVAPSDTITHIALQYNTTPTELSRLNHLSSSLLYPGQTLLVPDLVGADKSSENAKSPNTEHDVGVLEISEHNSSLDKEKMTFSPDKSLDRLLNNEGLHTSGDEISRKYLKVKSKYVTDGHGVVAGVLLVTPQTVMFNPCVSDHLVMERGREMYVVRLPLRAISRIILFEDIAAMVVGDMSKQYIPKTSVIDYTSEHNVSPKPGMIVCQETGERYALPNTFERNTHVDLENGKQNVERAVEELTMNRLQESTIFSNALDDESVTDQGIGSSSEQLTSESTMHDITMTSQTSEPPSLNNYECAGCQNFTDFMEDSQLSSTPKHKKLSDVDLPLEISDPHSNADTISNTDTLSDKFIDDEVANVQTNITTSDLQPDYSEQNENVTVIISEGKDDVVIETSETPIDSDLTKQSACNKESILSDEKLSKSDGTLTNIEEQDVDIISNTMVENHFNITPEMMEADIIVDDNNPLADDEGKSDVIDPKLDYFEYRDSCDESKDSGTSEVGSVNVSHQDDSESKDSKRHHLVRGSSLSDEARQWLGKRGVKLSLDTGGAAHYTPESCACDQDTQEMVTPRPASKVDDPLMYVAFKVHKTYWCPIRAKQNQIMGVPPNRDQKRREHWFAVPRERVDQFYNFLLYWVPDVCVEDSSGVSTPCSSECENVDEKVNRTDASGTEISRSLSLYSVSSKSSTRSLWEDEIPDLQAESQILTRKQVHLLTRKLPSRTVGHSWDLIYSTTIHGISLSTLYRNFQGNDTPVLIAIKDEKERVFGAFISEPPKVSDGFYGTGESMLYTFLTDTILKSYSWTGDNNFFIKGSKSSFVIGGGEGLFGLWLDEDLYYGRSHSCKTFGNETLSSCEDFICCGLEAWGFV